MRARCSIHALVVAAATLLASNCELPAALSFEQFQASKTSTDMVLPLELETDNNDERFLKDDVNADNGGKESTNTEERTMPTAMLDEMQDIAMRMAYQHWFDGGKTKADVRLIMGLPAKGEAVGLANWGKYLKYLEFLKEKEVEAANAAIIEAGRWKRIYKDWFFDRKTFVQVRDIFGLPAKGDAVYHVNWKIFLNYLKFYKEFSQQFT